MLWPVDGHHLGGLQQWNTIMANSIKNVHYVVSKIPCFQLKLLQMFKIQSLYIYFSYKYFTFNVNVYQCNRLYE